MADQPPSRGSRALKPRTGVQRRTKAERDAFAAQEADRDAKRAKEAASASPRAAKAPRRQPSRREDSTVAQNDPRPANQGDTGGVFGSAAAERPTTRRILDAGSEEIVLGNDTITPLPASSSAGVSASAQRQRAGSASAAEGAAKASTPLKALDDDAFEVGDKPDEIPRDIQTIGDSSDEGGQDDDNDDDEDRIMGSGRKDKRKFKGLRPLVIRNFVKTSRHEADQKPKSVLKAPKQPAAEVIELDDRDTDELELIKEQPSSPDLKRKTVKKPLGRTREVKFAHETPEGRTERLRMADDVDLLRRAFVPATADSTLTHEPNDGKLFLLQFPPLTPLLIDPTARKPDGGPEEDDEDNDDDDGDGDGDGNEYDDVVVVQVKREDALPKPPTAAGNKSKGPGPTIKKDPDAAQDPHDHNRVLTACSPLDQLPSGLVGKLNVHASGKITLDWAGTAMEVRLGTDVQFLQDAVLLRTTRTDDAHQSTAVSSSLGTPMADPGPGSDTSPSRERQPDHCQEESKAFALGQLDARMVVVPDWSKLYD